MFRQPNPEVLVVGAGPVGLIATLFLQQHGVRVEVVDMHQRTTQHSYALAIHPRTLRILDEAGLSEGLIGAGRKLTKVAYYEGRERRAEIDYSALASKHPYLLVIRQSLLERAAEEALRRKKLTVLWGYRLQLLDADGATLFAKSPSTPADQSVGVMAGLEELARRLNLSRTDMLGKSRMF